MLRFFRQIRQRLLADNKFSKYLLYAVGEILLVVIGILIALQINNWNETRKDRIKEQLVLIQLKEQFQANLIQLDVKIASRNSIIDAGNRILDYLDEPDEKYEASLIRDISVLTLAPTFNPVNNDIINSGKIELIQNQELKQLLTQWPTYVFQLSELESEYVSNYRNILYPFLLEIGIGREIESAFWEKEENFIFLLDKKARQDIPQFAKSDQQIEMDKLIGNKKLEGIVSNSIGLNYLGNIYSTSLRKRVTDILELLEKEIK